MWQIAYEDELYHHGIKGQKWGIRRYQNEDGTLTPEGRRRYGVGSDRIKSVNDIPSERGRQRYLKDQAKIQKQIANAQTAKGSKGVGLTDQQKKAIVIGSIAAIGTLAVAGTAIYLAKSGKGAELITKGKETVKTIKDQLSVNLKATDLQGSISPTMMPMDITKADRNAINPHRFNPFGFNGSHMNCVNCSVAADLRSKGYDVCARMNNTGWQMNSKAFEDVYGKPLEKLDPSDIPSNYKLGSPKRSEVARKFYMDTIKEICGNEDGHGIMTVTQEVPIPFIGESTFMQHAINWSKKGDTITFIDNQTNSNLNKLFSNASSVSDFWGTDIRPSILRTDNLQPDISKVGAFVVDRQTEKTQSIFKGVNNSIKFHGDEIKTDPYGDKHIESVKGIIPGVFAVNKKNATYNGGKILSPKDAASKLNNPNRKSPVSIAEMNQIRTLARQNKMTDVELAERFNLSPSTIYNILKGGR